MQTTNYKSKTLMQVAENLYRTGEDVYYARFKFKGKTYKKSLKTHDRKTAERKLRDFISEVQEEEQLKPDMTFKELAEKWLASLYELKPRSLLRRKLSVKTLLPFLGKKLFRDINAIDLQKWAAKRSQEVVPVTFNADRMALCMIFDFAKDTLEIIRTNPARTAVKKLREKKAVVTPPTREQFKQLLAYVEKSNSKLGANYMQFLAYSGLRADEARNVLWQHVDFVRGTIRITAGATGTKNHKERVLPMFAPLRTLLEKMAKEEHQPTDRLFPIFTILGVLIHASKAIGLPKGEHFSQHDMRHFFCSNCIEAGIDFATIANWLGHSDGGKLVAGTYGHLRAVHSSTMAKLVTFQA